MRRIFQLAVFCLAAGLLLGGCNGGCSSSNPLYPSYGPTPTPGGSGVTVTAVPGGSSYVYSPSSLSISAGTTVNWNLSSIHTVHIDDGKGDGLCGSTDLTSFPATTTFNTIGTYRVHCDIHSPCGSASCLSCTSMVMTVTVY